MSLGHSWKCNFSVRAKGCCTPGINEIVPTLLKENYPNMVRKRLDNNDFWRSLANYMTVILRNALIFLIGGRIHQNATFQMIVTGTVKTSV